MWIVSEELLLGSLVYNSTFIKGINSERSFISEKTVSVTFWTDYFVRNVFIIEKSAYFHNIVCSFDTTSFLKAIFCLYVNMFVLFFFFFFLTMLSEHIAYSSINFIIFIHLSRQKSNERRLFKPEGLFDLQTL